MISSGSRQRPVMTALEGFDVGGAVWLDDEAGDGLNPRCSYHWLSTWYLNGLAFPASTVRHGPRMMAQVWAENCLTYFSFVTYSYVPEHWNRMIPEPSGTILNWSSPLTSGTIGTVGFAASLGPCHPRLTADLDPFWMGNHPISRVWSFFNTNPGCSLAIAPVCWQISKDV